MSNIDNHTDPVADAKPIRPAQVSLNIGPAAFNDGHNAPKSPWQEHRFTLFGIGFGLVLLVVVVFVLPNKVTVEVANSADEDIPQEVVIKGPTESPWQEQQFGKERRETQEILAKLLDKQKQLEAIQVWVWAEAEYDQAKEMASQADIDYRKQEFLAAQQGYNNTLAKFNELLARSKTLYSDSLQLGEQAILEGDDKAARQHYELAALIKPLESEPKKGLQRAAVLQQVLEKISQGKQRQQQGQFEEARQFYQAALALDGESLPAQEQIQNIDVAIRDRDFGKQMSLGYAAINDQQYDKAIKAFASASAIKPNADDAKTALTQARNEKTQADIQGYMQAAEQLEQTEQWQEALDNYNKALALDGNLVAARVGAIRTGARADVDKKLQETIDAPERLTTVSVHQEFSEYLVRTKAIPNPGPRLQQQIQQLEAALHRALQPVQIQLLSDNQTEVSVYRVGDLGLFAEKALTLKPGTYTVVGRRDGYRDVRQEFTVSLDTNQSAITIQCVEKISKG
jgi:tetratricopeptide (TPR) repeat protein